MLVRILNTLRSRIWDMVFFLFSDYAKSTVSENGGLSRRLWELTREKFYIGQEKINGIFIQSSEKVSPSGDVHSNENHRLLENPHIFLKRKY